MGATVANVLWDKSDKKSSSPGNKCIDNYEKKMLENMEWREMAD